ncbi:hypothetical protein LMG23992_00885 [Cupriavidus laharis]|uniref:DUF3301 domain-containing protein n=1 Tax=Cupriavidus laharis TaxID=151654 RepID=A0ABM8WK10_9BURK|nr:hypothetical protein [Cupriavidus laharis]CAG9167704.1 hypothetical protein LMG23992_00885 [Cupriavidus laharis]
MSHAVAIMPESSFCFHLAGLAVLVLLLGVARAVWFVFSRREGRRERAMQLAAAATRCGLALGAMWTAIVYGSGALERAGAHNCRRLPTPDASARYEAEYCYLSQHKVLVRVYSVRRNVLLAERTFANSGPVGLRWDRGVLVFDPGAIDGKGTLILPPTLRDRLLARLP